MWSFRIFETMTGKPVVDVDPASGRWRRKFGDFGEGEHTFKVRDAKVKMSREVWRDATAHWSRTLVVMWAGVPVYAGLISWRKWNRDTGELTIKHSELRRIFSKRYPFGVTTTGPGGNLTVSNKSYAGAFRAIILRAAGGSWGATWDLPILYPADSSGSLSFTWRWYDWLLIEDILQQVEDLNGSADIDFRPRLASNGYLKWELVVGSPRLPGATFEVPVTANKSLAVKLTETDDGNDMLSGAFVRGKGTEEDMRFGEAGFMSGPDIPTLDASIDAKDVGNQSQLTSMATEHLTKNRSSTVQDDFSLIAEQDSAGSELLDVANLQPGARINLHFDGDEFIDDGWKNNYLIAVSGDRSRTLGLEVQPI